MVKLDGKSAMLGHWQMVLKQAEESARAGRLDEALTQLGRSDVADHRQVIQLRGRLAQELVDRAARRAEADDLTGAIGDLNAADRHGAPPDVLAAARLRLADRVAGEVRADLEAGEPARVSERVADLERHQISGPALRRAREAAESWQAALDEGRRGEFGRALEALDRAARLAGETGQAALAAARRDLQGRQAEAHPRAERLYEALAGRRWAEALTAAEALLEIVPEHPAARQARGRAWQQIAALSPSASLPARNGPPPTGSEPARPSVAPTLASWPFVGPRVPTRIVPAPAASSRSGSTGPDGRFLLWADAIGGYLVCLENEVQIGRASPEGHADIPLMGDLSRHHATLARDGDGYILRAGQPTFLNNRRIESAPLRDGDVIRLGSTVELEFHQPSPISSTARLVVVSRHRLPVAVDGVILMAETCILGPSPQAHIPAPNLADPVILYRQGPALWCRAPGEFEVDGQPFTARAPLGPRSNVLGEGFSFSLEPLGPGAPRI